MTWHPLSLTPPTDRPWMINYGGGLNSETLVLECIKRGHRPAANSGCSSKFKIQPAQRWRAENGLKDCVSAIGFDAGEAKRVNKRKCARALIDQETLEEEPWYPLFAWGISRASCAATVEASGVGPVPKSACFFCPNNRPAEWAGLSVELFRKSLLVEFNAYINGKATESGLGRSRGYLRDFNQWPSVKTLETEDTACVCYDGQDPE